jgi:hypothetical protein
MIRDRVDEHGEGAGGYDDPAIDEAGGVGCCRAPRLAAAQARITRMSLPVPLVIAD